LPAVTYGVLYSDFLINFFFDKEFIPAILTLQILFFGLAFQYPNWMLNATLISMNRQRVIMVFGATGLIFKVILNFIMIPKYGFNGSAVATIISEFLLFAAAATYLYRYHIKLPIFQVAIKPVLGSIVIFGAFYFLKMIPIVPITILSAILYLMVIYFLKTFDQNEIDTFTENLQKMFKIPRSSKQTSEG
jgi:O-antigen/teichoic acid export membrane protein